MKKQCSEAAGVSVPGDMKALIHDHSLFFDKLVELIPAKFYLPPDDEEKVWFQGLSKSQKVKAKKKTAENVKKARRDRLDPEKSSKTTLDLLKEFVEKEKSALKSDDDAEENAGSAAPEKGDNLTYDELRQKLRLKIESFKTGRGTEVDIERRRAKNEARKRKREEWAKQKGKRKQDKEKDEKLAMEVSAAAEGIEFGKVKLGDDDLKKNHKKRKLSKEEELERARKLEAAKNDPEKGKLVTEKHSWQAATSRAMGVKIHDNPKLLKESILREKKKHKKSVEKWKDRVKNTENVKKEKQNKRKGNIQSNIEKKKMKKIERREKKLMKRPGRPKHTSPSHSRPSGTTCANTDPGLRSKKCVKAAPWTPCND
ncbi:hypothetical protein V2J09_008345 [Rumex salicifolius]